MMPVLSYHKKRRMLFLLFFSLFSLLFWRGFQLHLVEPITERIRLHAIPVAISVLYHGHKHDYTGLREVAQPFYGVGDNHNLIKAAISQNIQDKNQKYYWVADDRGFADYVIASFYLFGPSLKSMYLMWFLVLLISTSCFLISFGRKLSSLGYLCLTYLGIHLAISCLPLAAGGGGLYGIGELNSVTIYETRFLDVLAFIPVLHMMFLAWSAKAISFWRGVVPLLIQMFIFIALYHARSSLGWEIVAVLSFCLFVIMLRVYKRKNNKLTKLKIKSAVIVSIALLCSLMGLNIYKHIVYDKSYFKERGARTIWHNALMGLSVNDVFRKQYGLTGVNDLVSAEQVVKYAKESNYCSKELTTMKNGQQVLDTLGNAGVIDWRAYENCAKSLYFHIVSENKLEFIKTFLIIKPINTLQLFFLTMKNSGNAQIDQLRSNLNAGWYPLNIINVLFYMLIVFFSFHAIAKARFQLFVMTGIIFICSFIPAVLFYCAVLTMGGLLVSGGLLCYLFVIIFLNKSLQFFKKEITMSHSQSYPLKNKTLSVIIPAYNEEKRIAETIHQVYSAACKTLDDFEIMVVDDGSIDSTYKIAKETASKLGHQIKILSHEINKGVGAAFHLGLEHARFPQLSLVPGDNAFHVSGVELLFSQAGVSPLVISYRQNMEARTPLRYLLSRFVTTYLRLVSGAKVRDAHSLYLFPVAETRSLNIKTQGYGYHLEVLSRLLNKMKSFSEVPVSLNPQPDASSKVMKPKTLIIFGMTISKLFLLKLIGRL